MATPVSASKVTHAQCPFSQGVKNGQDLWELDEGVRIIIDSDPSVEKRLPTDFQNYSPYVKDQLGSLRMDKGRMKPYCSYKERETDQTIHLVHNRRLANALLSFSRQSDRGEEDTPFCSDAIARELSELKLELALQNLPKTAHKLVKASISDFLGKNIHEFLDSWSLTTSKIVRGWKDKEINGYECFSVVAAAICARHLLGIEKESYSDFAEIWRQYFAPKTSSCFSLLEGIKKIKPLFNYKMSFYPEICQHVKSVTRDGRSYGSTIIDYWMRIGLGEAVIGYLSDDKRVAAEKVALGNDLTLSEKVLVDNSIVLLMTMQETMAFVLTEVARRLGLDSDLQNYCRQEVGNSRLSASNHTVRLINETLRLSPPKGHYREIGSRRVHCMWDNDQVEHYFQFSPGDNLVIHPLTQGHDPEIYSHPEKFNISRDEGWRHNPFGRGPHQCPASFIAVEGIKAILGAVLTRYEIKAKPQEPTFVVYGTLKHIEPVMLTMCTMKSSLSLREEPYL